MGALLLFHLSIQEGDHLLYHYPERRAVMVPRSMAAIDKYIL
jgi:hypothetical protein